MSLLEREDDLAALEDLFADCLQGGGHVAVVSGPVGCGKTALLQNLADRVTKSDALFLSATASRIERGLPLGVVSELFRGVTLTEDSDERVKRLLGEGALTATFHDDGVDAAAAGQMMAPTWQGVYTVLRDLAERRPVVIGIDDVHYADMASLQFLLYLSRRLRSSRILLVLNECIRPHETHPLFYEELFHLPHCRRIRLAPLTQCGVSGMLAERLEAGDARRLAPCYHAVSGGNPLLVHALFEDFRTSAASTPPELIVGDAFAQAALSCFYRCGGTALRLARALAVLRDSASPSVLGKLADLNAEFVGPAVDALNLAGLLDDGRFRHPVARAAVLDNMVPEERQALHGRAAQVLHDDGASATVVANHLIVAEHVGDPWVVHVLREAADDAMLEGEVHLALSYLRLAHEACADEGQRARIAVALTRAEWRVNPSTVGWRLPELTAAVREGRLHGREAITVAYQLLWYGRTYEALDVLDRLGGEEERLDDETLVDLDITRMWVSYSYPGLRGSEALPDPRKIASVTRSLHLQAAGGLATVLSGEADDDTLAGAEQVLQRSRLDGRSLGPIVAALATLVYTDNVERAGFWCDPLLEDAAVQGTPTWRAVLTAARALISLRQGELAAAEAQARDALAVLSPKSWGVAIGEPLATMLLAAVALGKYDNAATYLCLPVPEAMYQTPSGLRYLQARGWYYFATGHFHAAYGDFTTCGEMMTRWAMDLPSLVPWRTDAAQACLRLGRTHEARELANQQLSLLSPGDHRTRAITLRVLAMTSDVANRPALLNEAVEAQQVGGDRFELALTLAELSHAQHALGEHGPGRLAARRAYQLAQRCGAEALRSALLPEGGDGPPPGPGSLDDVSLAAELSDAERRVAALAAKGHTNRQIAGKLYITVSTVEQHLTRVYRKLKVNHRTDLPSRLQRIAAD